MTSINRNIAGVYGILHTSTSRIYVGSAVKIASRWKYHRNQLKAGKHENTYLQHTWNKYGEDAFQWLILETVTDLTHLIPTEQKWIDYYQAIQRDKGFNMYPTAGSPLGRKMTEEQRRQQSIRQKALKRKQSEYQKQSVSKALQGNKHGAGSHYHGVLTEQDVKRILERCITGELHKYIAQDFGVSQPTITRIARRKIWTNVAITPEMEQALQGLYGRRAKGSKVAQSVFSTDDVRLIKARLARGDSGTILAKEYHVTERTISCIRLGITWSHVTDFTPLTGPPIRLVAQKRPKHIT